MVSITRNNCLNSFSGRWLRICLPASVPRKPLTTMAASAGSHGRNWKPRKPKITPFKPCCPVIQIAWVATHFLRPICSGERNAETRGPVPPTNRLAKLVTAPTPRNPGRGMLEGRSFGVQTEYSTNSPSIARRTSAGSVIKILPATITPRIEPSRKYPAIDQLMCWYIRLARPQFDPNWTMPCTGNTTNGGRKEASTTRSTSPPPRPMAAVSAEVRKLNSTSPVVDRIVRSGGIKSTMFIRIEC